MPRLVCPRSSSSAPPSRIGASVASGSGPRRGGGAGRVGARGGGQRGRRLGGPGGGGGPAPPPRPAGDRRGLGQGARGRVLAARQRAGRGVASRRGGRPRRVGRLRDHVPRWRYGAVRTG